MRFLTKASRWREVANCFARMRNPSRLTFDMLSRREDGYPKRIESSNGLILEANDWDELTTVWHVWCADEYFVPKECKSILDLGANIGAFALWASARCPIATIYSVEPFPSTYESLNDTIRRNKLDDRVRCEQIAVGGANGLVAFDATPGKRSYCRQIVRDSDSAQKVMVPCLTLESFLDRCGLSEVDCIKMDIEGGEHALFAAASDATLRRAKLYTMEYHDAEKSRMIWDRFEKAGFQRIAFKDSGWSGLATYRRIGE